MGIACSLLISCGDNNANNSVISKIPDLAVAVDVPQNINEVKLPSGTCLLIVRNDGWMFLMNHDSTFCQTQDEFHDYIQKNGGRLLNAKLALKTDSKSDQRMTETVSLLKADSIVRFNLVTDLHNEIP